MNYLFSKFFSLSVYVFQKNGWRASHHRMVDPFCSITELKRTVVPRPEEKLNNSKKVSAHVSLRDLRRLT